MAARLSSTIRNLKEISFGGLFVLLGATGCGYGSSGVPTISAASTACSPGVAEVLVGDGFVQRLCGCTETGNTFFAAGSPLTCTIPVGTKVFFYTSFYTGYPTLHAVESVGTPSFPSTRTPDPAFPVVSFYQFSTAGTYQFRDMFNHAVSGSFIVF